MRIVRMRHARYETKLTVVSVGGKETRTCLERLSTDRSSPMVDGI